MNTRLFYCRPTANYILHAAYHTRLLFKKKLDYKQRLCLRRKIFQLKLLQLNIQLHTREILKENLLVFCRGFSWRAPHIYSFSKCLVFLNLVWSLWPVDVQANSSFHGMKQLCPSRVTRSLCCLLVLIYTPIEQMTLYNVP